jgi:2-C-methyl-D-erythritol 4-phosphate cytidylyltransferase/2-C-methyl-D-erythritol 2,4-cyclodiphosphate synthase
MHVGVIIVAAGRSERMRSTVPKPLLELGGRSLLRRSVEAFDEHPLVQELVVVLPRDLVGDGPTLVGSTRRPCRVVAGGERRQDSVRQGLAELSQDTDLVLIHDAARPFVDRPLIDRVIEAAGESGAAVPAVPARDTVKRTDAARGFVSETIPRDQIWLAQTPQGFRRPVLVGAVQREDASADVTDDAMLVERAGHPVRVVQGDERNVKITTPDDLVSARARLTVAPRVGTGYDLHRLADGRALVLAGVAIGGGRGPVAHSDGDVVCHALVDAILGAAGEGDIGRHFPDTDPQWKDSRGLDLLARAVSLVDRSGFSVANVDVTVILERPKLAGHAQEMRANLAKTLGVTVSQVSVKAKTNEAMDAVGRGEAIAAHAVAMLAAGGDR